MGVIEDNERLKARQRIEGMAEDARWYIGECERMDRESAEANRKTRAEKGGPTFFITAPEHQYDHRMRREAELILILAAQQKQIDELAEQLRRSR